MVLNLGAVIILGIFPCAIILLFFPSLIGIDPADPGLRVYLFMTISLPEA